MAGADIEVRSQEPGVRSAGEPRGRTLRLDRNGKVYYQTMLPNGDIVWRFQFARRSVVATAEELFTHFARLQGGELFPESISP